MGMGNYSDKVDVRCKATDGTVFWVKAAAGPEYFLHPVFLHYFAASVAIFVLLAPNGLPAGLPSGWTLVIGWLVFCTTSLLTLAVVSVLVAYGERRGWIKTIFTPIFYVPMLLVSHGALAYFAQVVSDGVGYSASDLAIKIAQAVMTTAIFDIIHARYVVLAHPYAHSLAPPKEMPPGQTQPEVVSSAAPAQQEGVPPMDSIRIGTQTFALTDILTIRTRDHRLEVTTREGATLQRARMSDLPEATLALHGIQISRSLWVAFDAITDVIEDQSSQIDLRLWSGETERVAKPRLHAFRQAWRVRNAADAIGADRQITARSGAAAARG